MHNLLFMDFETTGFPRNGLVHSEQARVCQGAMILTTETGRILSEFVTLFKPRSWTISPEAEKVHGVTQKDCEDYGIAPDHFIKLFAAFQPDISHLVAHGSNFDERMLKIELAYFNQRHEKHNREVPHETPWFCTKTHARDICQIPPTEKMIANNRNHYKDPTLVEAYEIIVGQRFQGTAHTAMDDARACMEIYFGIKREI